MNGEPEGTIKVLIVDDEADAVRLMLWLVKDLWPGAQVQTACDGNQAISRAAALKPDLVLTDIRMPGLNGVDLCHLLREAPDLRHAKLLALTGFHDPRTHMETIMYGADEYMRKPVDPRALRRCLLRLMGQGPFRPHAWEVQTQESGPPPPSA